MPITYNPEDELVAPISYNPDDEAVDTLADDWSGLGATARLAGKGLAQALDAAALDYYGDLPQRLNHEQTRLGGLQAQLPELKEKDPIAYQGALREQGETMRRIAGLEQEVKRTRRRISPTASQMANRVEGARGVAEGLSPEMKSFNKAEGAEAWKIFLRNPVEVSANVMAQGLISSVPSLVAGAAGSTLGPAGTAAGVGYGSFLVEYSNTLVDEMHKAGATSPAEIEALFADPERLASIRTKAVQRGVPVAAFDAATGGLAGKFLRPVLGAGSPAVRQVAAAVGKETALQAVGGMAGEAAGQLSSEGRITSGKEILLEGLAEVLPGAGEVALNVGAATRKPIAFNPKDEIVQTFGPADLEAGAPSLEAPTELVAGSERVAVAPPASVPVEASAPVEPVAVTPAPPAEPAGPTADSEPGFPAAPAAPGSRGMPLSPERLTDAKPVRRAELLQALQGVLGVVGGHEPFRVGRFHQKALGIYKTRPEVIRLLEAQDIPTAVHETGHGLQKHFFGSVTATGLKGLPGPVRQELLKLGKALYGSRRPVAGYASEGFAEFTRYALTRDDAATVAPATVAFWETQVLAKNPELAKTFREARRVMDIWRLQGAELRARMSMQKPPGLMVRAGRRLRQAFTVRANLEEFDALNQLSRAAEGVRGTALPPSKDPYALASALRSIAGPRVQYMVDHAMVDVWGNPVGRSLSEVLAPVRGRGDDFSLYLWGRRAVERWGKGKNPGLALEDAESLLAKLDSPEFALAAEGYYEWNRGLLEYVRQADPALSPLVAAILEQSHDYAPLNRVFDEQEVRSALSGVNGLRGNPLRRMLGSGRDIKEILNQTLTNAFNLVQRAHRMMVLRSIVRLSRLEGMGFLVEEVPKDRVREQLNFELIRRQLEALGLDTTDISEGEIMTYFTAADRPRGEDPVIAVKEPGDEVRWYHLSPDLYDIVAGVDATRLPQLAGLLGLVQSIVAGSARLFRAGTTGYRASFSLVTNPLRDLQTFLAQSHATSNPARLAANYVRTLGAIVRDAAGGRTSPYQDVFRRLGLQIAEPLGQDIAYTKRAARGLFHGKVLRQVASPLDAIREVLSLPEHAPRIAELRMMAEEAGWRPGQPMTADQAVSLALGARRVTTDFAAGGSEGRLINQFIPFYNATIQGTRASFRRLFNRDPKVRLSAWLRGLTYFTLPALALWWRNKDEEWYRELPWRERYIYSQVSDGVNVWQIPRSQEWGAFFQVVPEAIFDSWYRQDPEAASVALEHVLSTLNPLDYPVPLRAAKEQWSNRIAFWDRPIVPRSQLDLPRGEQVGPYTSKPAKWLGEAFPNTLSPRRIDAGLAAFFGGTAPDIMQALGLVSRRNRDFEPADIPVAGRVARRGGEFSANMRSMAQFYDDLVRYEARAKSSTKTGPEVAYAYVLSEMAPVFRLMSQVADATPDRLARQSLYRNMAAEARSVLALRPKADDK